MSAATDLHRVNDLMPTEQLWGLVTESLAAVPADADVDERQEVQEAELVRLLTQLPWPEIVRFANRFRQLLADAYRDDLWCAAAILRGGCSDDAFLDFRAWLVAQGEAVYTAALADPDSLADVAAEADHGDDWYEFEDFCYAAADAFRVVTSADLDDYAAERPAQPALEPRWRDDDASMRALCPGLMAWFDDE